MAVQTITYDDKSYLNQNSDIADVNKVNDTDMNEIKSVVNNNADMITPVVLYNNPTGTNGNVTLSDSSANYSYLEIYYNRNNLGFSSMKIDTNYMTNVSMFTSYYVDTILRFYVSNISISGTTITRNYSRVLNVESNLTLVTQSDTYFYINKVVGYK